MKNPHGVEPTRYMTFSEGGHAIYCHPEYGPTVGDDIFIKNNCNEANSCSIMNNGTTEYHYHPEYRSSLFVGTAGPNKQNDFSVLDYEVYTH